MLRQSINVQLLLTSDAIDLSLAVFLDVLHSIEMTLEMDDLTANNSNPIWVVIDYSIRIYGKKWWAIYYSGCHRLQILREKIIIKWNYKYEDTLYKKKMIKAYCTLDCNGLAIGGIIRHKILVIALYVLYQIYSMIWTTKNNKLDD